jgi:RNA polymerase sigma factor (sigma-70 family)
MYLGGSKRLKSKSLRLGLGHLPNKLEDKELESLVIKLRGGDNEVINTIIGGHLRLAIQISARYALRFSGKTDEIVGTAFLAVTRSVKQFRERAKDNNITPYIVSIIHSDISDFLCHDSVVRITRYQLRKMACEYDLTKENNMPEFMDYHDRKVFERCNKTEDEDIRISNLEFEDVLEKLQFTRYEMLVLRLKLDGWSESEIAEHIGTNREKIRVVKELLVAKLKPYFGE